MRFTIEFTLGMHGTITFVSDEIVIPIALKEVRHTFYFEHNTIQHASWVNIINFSGRRHVNPDISNNFGG